MRGGRRRRHAPPALGASDVLEARRLYAQGAPYKTLVRLFNVSRDALSDAINGKGAYAANLFCNTFQTIEPSVKSKRSGRKPRAT